MRELLKITNGVEELNPCPKCGRPVEISYITGIGKSIQVMMKHPFAGTNPTWYILCGYCGHNMATRYNRGTYEEQQKAKRYLIKAWNDRREVDSVEVPEYVQEGGSK